MKGFCAILIAFLIVISCAACNTTPSSSLPSSTPSQSFPISSTDSSSDDSSSTPSHTDSSIAGPSFPSEGDSPEDEIIENPPPEDDSVHGRHYCYLGLTENQKVYYEAMYTAAINMTKSWVALGPATKEYKTDVAVVRNALVNDHPDIFWFPAYYATALGKDGLGKSVVLMYFSTSSDSGPAFLVAPGEVYTMEKELEKAVKEITKKVTATDPYEIELQLHDLLCERVEYSDDKTDPMIFTAYGALVNRRALCEGYSRAMQLLLGEFGIRAITVTGTAGGEGHMWNAVELGGEWYHLDVTWNDTKGNVISHEYFNLSDELILEDHSFSKNYDQFTHEELESGTISFNTKKPDCTGTQHNFFNRSGFIYFPDNTPALAAYLIRQKDAMVEVRFSDLAFRDRFYGDTEKYVASINDALLAANPKADFYIGGISVSNLVLRLYKK